MWSYPDVLEVEKLYTNDTHKVAITYGIEAAGRVIATVSLRAFLHFIMQMKFQKTTVVFLIVNFNLS